ncbi:hypothetical protein L1987_44980 [Smallanthus sonchifolius]|uniref:Uncharacterized protein n=1 Tax=Smallanthus sonchifolius TaxID=185202 RepID=A0ACB9GQX5_9ASTR|nr:hypothetical protein L1987_44980 [Smallanthus sonchifolius]
MTHIEGIDAPSSACGEFTEIRSHLCKRGFDLSLPLSRLGTNEQLRGSHRVSHKQKRIFNNLAMAPAFNVGSEAGLKKLDEYLLSCSYISGYQASKDDLTVHAAFSKPPSSQYVNVSRWFNHIEALLRLSGVSAEGSGVTVEGSAAPVANGKAAPVANGKAAAADEDDDSDVDLFGEETEEEKKAAEDRAAAVKASGKKKESGKSSVLMDVKPWDDETDMKKLEEAVRSVQMEGLLWGASKLEPVGVVISSPSTRSSALMLTGLLL